MIKNLFGKKPEEKIQNFEIRLKIPLSTRASQIPGLAAGIPGNVVDYDENTATIHLGTLPATQSSIGVDLEGLDGVIQTTTKIKRFSVEAIPVGGEPVLKVAVGRRREII